MKPWREESVMCKRLRVAMGWLLFLFLIATGIKGAINILDSKTPGDPPR
jgi:hypothetical protein